MMPKITIITVVFNAKLLIEKTIKSVISQTYSNIEYIIMDGGSSDGTLGIISKYTDKISRIISESDKGIYDAMNKGLQMASGDYVWFMNAGDVIYSKETLQQVMNLVSKNRGDVYYGETEEVDMDGNSIGMRRLKTPDKLTWKSLAMGMVVCHQSIIIRKALCDEYNIKYHISADIDWIIRILKKSEYIVNTNLTLSKFKTGGISRHNIIQSLIERFEIMVKHYGFFTTLFNHFIIGTKFILFVLRNGRY